MEDEWIDPQYAEVVEFYRRKREAKPPARRPGKSGRTYGDHFVIVVDPSAQRSFVAPR
jgi:lipoprotein-anchoring transpeptidase ErfK/SrfK